MRWKRTSSTATVYRNVSFNGPANGPFQQGQYIQVYQPDNGNGAPDDDLVSNIIYAKTTEDCFSFYYYIHGEGVMYMELDLQSNGANIPLWIRHNSAGDMWHQTKINIGKQANPFKLRFIAASGYGAVGLANFSATPYPCGPQGTLCDFESGNCGWAVNGNNTAYNFKLIEANDWQRSSSYDHSTESSYGHFMEATNGKINDWTELESSPPVTGNNDKYCLRFWYWRHTSSANRIDLIQRIYHEVEAQLITNNNKTIWTSTFTFPKHMWHRAQANVLLGSAARFAIRSTQMISDTSSSVDIDDISLIPGPCSLPIDCDFNKDMCGWTRDTDMVNYIWDHGFGRLEEAKVLNNVIHYTPIDRSAGSDGMFMYTDFSLLNDQGMTATMVIHSEFVPATSGSCLTFYYLPISFSNKNATFTITLSDANDKTISTAFAYNTTNDPLNAMSPRMRPWTPQFVNISTPNTMTQSIFRIVFMITSKSPCTYLAIDDITFRPGFCVQTTTVTTNGIPLSTVTPGQTDLFHCSPTEIIPKSKVCDGVKDCSNGADEANCGTSRTTFIPSRTTSYKVSTPSGTTLPTIAPVQTLSCDFESRTFCNWKDDPSHPWLSDAPKNQLYFRFPKKDHTMGNEQSYLAYIEHNGQNSGENSKGIMKEAISGLTDTGTETVCFSLWYYMNAGEGSQLNITVRSPDDKIVNHLTRHYGHGEKWTLLQLETDGLKNGYVFTISGLVSYGVIGIDDINSQDQPCIDNIQGYKLLF